MSEQSRTRPPQLTRPTRPIRPGRERRVGGLALAGLLVVAALAVGRFQDDGGERFGLVSQVRPTDPALAELATAPEVGKLAPNFRLESLDGDSVQLSDLRGRPVLLNFWTVGCSPCVTEMPAIQTLADSYGERIAVLGVNGGDPADQSLVFATAQEIRYPLLLDPERKVTEAYRVQTVPTSFVIDADGVIASIGEGALSIEQMEERLAPLLV